MEKDLFRIHNDDARNISKIIKDPIVDVTITSPPYFDLKDYGNENQIGYGQKYEEYLNDLKKVFKSVYKCTKDSGSLWVVIDAFKRDGEVIPLPFDFSNKIKSIGWKLQEVIIWGKDRTVPWAHKGQMRSLFEYVLVFSKSNNYNFFIDDVREFETLKKWWVRYPERYNPKGKTPDAIWNFDIPTQGSWGNGYIRHFCPLPEEMIAQILKLTTREGDLVLDPFAGSGSVLSKADNMKRRYIGTELNTEYIKMFHNYLSETGEKKREDYEFSQNNLIRQDTFQELILNLRALKYARVLIKKLKDDGLDEIIKINVERNNSTPTRSNSIIVVDFNLLIKSNDNQKLLREKLDKFINLVPLSKFGIEPNFIFISKIDDFINKMEGLEMYVYTDKITHKVKKVYNIEDLKIINHIIFSSIHVDLNENAYD